MRSFRHLVLCAALAGSSSASAESLLPPDKPIAQVIDHYIDARQQEEKIKPAPQIDDANLIRRLTLDLNGRIPTPAEVKAYVESKEPDKREKLVERLMASPAYVRHQVNQFDAMMAHQSRRGGGGELRTYLQLAFAENRPWDRIFRELVTPDEKDPKQKGAIDFLKPRVADLDRLTNDVSVLFFGVNVSCAQCHNHPLVTDWKQDHFYGMKAFFARTFDNGGMVAEREFGLLKFKPNKGAEKQAQMMFLTGKVVNDPNFREPTKEEASKEKDLFEKHKKDKTAPPAPKSSARAKLVEAALQPGQSDFFARSIANRLWYQMLGYGLVNPLDQMHSENEPSHPELLQWLARDMATHAYDLRRLVKGIALSKTYSRSSVWSDSEGDVPDDQFFAVAQLKPMTPMQLATSLRLAAADPQSFEKLKPEDFEKRIEAIEQSARGFAGMIAQPTGNDFQIGVNEALLFSNSDRITKDLLADGSDRLLNRLKDAKDTDSAVKLIYSSVMNRAPRVDEVKAIGEYLQRRTDRPGEAFRQVIWALISGAEFRFNY